MQIGADVLRWCWFRSFLVGGDHFFQNYTIDSVPTSALSTLYADVLERIYIEFLVVLPIISRSKIQIWNITDIKQINHSTVVLCCLAWSKRLIRAVEELCLSEALERVCVRVFFWQLVRELISACCSHPWDRDVFNTMRHSDQNTPPLQISGKLEYFFWFSCCWWCRVDQSRLSLWMSGLVCRIGQDGTRHRGGLCRLNPLVVSATDNRSKDQPGSTWMSL